MLSLRDTIDGHFLKALAKDPGGVSYLSRLRTRTLHLCYGVFLGLTDEELAMRSMGLVYTTLLSIVPLLAFSFSVLKAFGAHTRFEIFLYYLLEPLGEKGVDLSLKVIGFVENINVSVLGGIGLSMLVYTVISQIQKVESSLNYIWNIRATRNIARRFSNYMSVLLIGPVLIFSALGITASLMSSTVVKSVLSLPRLGQFILMLGSLLPYLLSSGAFALVYVFLPNTRVRFSAALAGGLFAGAAWKFVGWAFTNFVASSAQYSAIYSGFAILVLFLIWVYWSWFTLLVGARVAYSFQHPIVTAHSHRLSPGQTERIGLAIMVLIGGHFLLGKRAWSLNALSQHLGVPVDEVQSLIDLFLKADYIVPTDREPATYVLSRDPSSLRIADILRTIREGTVAAMPHAMPRVLPEIEGIIETLESGISRALAMTTLRDLFPPSSPD
ncbi:MAG: YihY/virulence factor BrkB family protein [Thermodesulfovibrionales bacterium]